MSFSKSQITQSYVFWDATGNGNAIAPYQAVSFADATEVAAALAAGVRDAIIGRIVVPTPINTGAPTREVIGVTCGAAYNGQEVEVAIFGIAEVMVNAAVAQGAWLFPAAAATRTSAQTPFTNLPEATLKVDPRFNLTYNLCLADDTAITPASTGANALYYPIGIAEEAATAQYNVIPVRLHLPRFYA